MSDHESKNGSTPNPLEEWSKLGRDLLGAGRKMFEGLSEAMAKASSTSSSSPTEMPSEWTGQSSNGSSPTPFEMAERDDSSSTSSDVASVSPDTSSASEPVAFTIVPPDPYESREREVTLIVHYATFGNEEQLIEDARRLLRVLEVKGVNIIAAKANDTIIEAAPAS